ncbi:MAG: DNA gyrase/topoisomerase IV subunit A [Flavobacteriaceae bacterium]|nr:DNA gyrase/topoisomerase IV subunit A [Flavobacteriaceae bacterium]
MIENDSENNENGSENTENNSADGNNINNNLNNQEEENIETEEVPQPEASDSFGKESITKITGMYKQWFMDYASYVILERAVPQIDDGFKPVQRRILQSMKDLDDGRYNKVANLVGHTMQYHPHGDASIADAMVQIAQKDLLIDMQGNWGNILTGDRAAASRYIEARLSKFALEVVFNPKTTNWQASYDGRRKEPLSLPVKFPMLLAQGGEGIAVGLSTKILPHNFNELIDASLKILKGKSFELFPDFLTGGIVDVSNYNDAVKGSKIRVRARVEVLDKKTLVIREIPFGTTTGSLIESIIKANDKGKIRIKKIEDNTAADVEILIHLPTGVSPDKTIDALYAFSSCENSISPNTCIIKENKPHFVSVSSILIHSTNHTVDLLKLELEIELEELNNQWHFSSLERIFIENRIYRDIEEVETWEAVIEAIDNGLKPYIAHLKKPVTKDDIVRLTEIRIKKISKFDIDKAQQFLESLESQISEVLNHLEHIIDFAIVYFKKLKTKYGKGKERKTEIRVFDSIDASKVIVKNEKLYINREEGFIGIGLKKDEYIADCSDIDDVIVFKNDGSFTVSKVVSKAFFGKDILHVAIFKKNDKRTVYNMAYSDGATNISYMKRFYVTGITRDKKYDMTTGEKGSNMLYFSANPNGEAETVTVLLRQSLKVKKMKWDFNFSELMIKGRTSRGNILSKYAVKSIKFKESGASTLKPRKIWFDEIVNKLNVESRGELLGEFTSEDRILLINSKGLLKTIKPELNTHFETNLLVMEKWEPNKPITAAYLDGEKQRYFAKRFLVENASKEELFISETTGSRLIYLSTDQLPVADIEYSKRSLVNTKIDFGTFIKIKGIKAIGNQLSVEKIKKIHVLKSKPFVAENVIEETVGSNNDREELKLDR